MFPMMRTLVVRLDDMLLLLFRSYSVRVDLVDLYRSGLLSLRHQKEIDAKVLNYFMVRAAFYLHWCRREGDVASHQLRS